MRFEHVAAQVASVGGRAATTPAAGRLLYDFVLRAGAQAILELGFAHGNSTCYMAAALDERQSGTIVTIDLASARDRDPNILTLLSRTQLADHVTPVFAHTSYNWELMHFLEQHRRGDPTAPTFDFVFIDGAHTWEVDGLAFLLADRLLRPGGWVLFDDIHWSLGASPTLQNSERVRALSEEERRTPQILKVFSLLAMQQPGYGNFEVKGNWGWAYKDPGESEPALAAGAVRDLYAGALAKGALLA